MWVLTHQVYQANQAPIPAPNTVRRPIIARMQLLSNYSLTGENDSQANYTVPNILVNVGKTIVPKCNQWAQLTTWRKRLQTVCAWGKLAPNPKCKEDHNNHNVRETIATQQILRRMTAAITYGKSNGPNINIEMTGNYTTIPVYEEVIQAKMWMVPSQENCGWKSTALSSLCESKPGKILYVRTTNRQWSLREDE